MRIKGGYKVDMRWIKNWKYYPVENPHIKYYFSTGLSIGLSNRFFRVFSGPSDFSTESTSPTTTATEISIIYIDI